MPDDIDLTAELDEAEAIVMGDDEQAGWHSATMMAWDLAGRPRRDSLPVSLFPGRCAVCGTEAEETVPAKATVGAASFTSRDLLACPRSDVTCYPCAWALARLEPPHALTRTWTVACAPGTDLGASNPKAVPAGPVIAVAAADGDGTRIRYDGSAGDPGAYGPLPDPARAGARLRGDGYERAAEWEPAGTAWRVPVRRRRTPGLLFTSKNDMRPVARLLASPPDGPWCAAVADTGQKHTLPWTPLNYGRGRWRVRFESEDVTAVPGEFAALLTRSALLRRAGLGRDEVCALEPGPWKLTRDVLPLWRVHCAALMPYRGSGLLRLANLMITAKEHTVTVTAPPAGS